MATYKKKPKAINLKPTKITDEELKVIKTFVDTLNQLQMKVGGLEVQKGMLVQEIVKTKLTFIRTTKS